MATVKFEDEFIVEFVEYHLLNGVEHFYFYDNDNEIPLTYTLRNYLDYCTIINISGPSAQIKSYNHWLKNFKKETVWVAVIDIDEFLLPIKHKTVKEFLQTMENYNSIAINWMIFGSGPHIKKPNGLVTFNFQFTDGVQHSHYKCISKSSSIKSFAHPHFPKLKMFRNKVNAKGSILKGEINEEYCNDIIRINHYYTKSVEEFEQKLKRPTASTNKLRPKIEGFADWIYDEPYKKSKFKDSVLWDKFGKFLSSKLFDTNDSSKASKLISTSIVNH